MSLFILTARESISINYPSASHRHGGESSETSEPGPAHGGPCCQTHTANLSPSLDPPGLCTLGRLGPGRVGLGCLRKVIICRNSCTYVVLASDKADPVHTVDCRRRPSGLCSRTLPPGCTWVAGGCHTVFFPTPRAFDKVPWWLSW